MFEKIDLQPLHILFYFAVYVQRCVWVYELLILCAVKFQLYHIHVISLQYFFPRKNPMLSHDAYKCTIVDVHNVQQNKSTYFCAKFFQTINYIIFQKVFLMNILYRTGVQYARYY